MKNIMSKFLEDRHRLKFIQEHVQYSEEERPHLLITHPAILATFMGYAKFQYRTLCPNREVFFRGQTNNYANITPSLLRGNDFDKINHLSNAYIELKSKTKELFSKTGRFQNETIDNLFQHYGIKSQTLDLVDNIYIAIWFATNRWKRIESTDKMCTYEPSNEKYGWIYFMLVEPPTPTQSINTPSFNGYCDLRKYNSSLSARLHCQHGITYVRNNGGKWTDKNRCFDDLIFACVKFPCSDDFKLNGPLFTNDFLFPPPEIDNTYKMLQKHEFNGLINSIEKKYDLKVGDLGQIWNYDFHQKI